MRFFALEKITMKVLGEIVTINAGEVLNLSEDQAARLAGKISSAPPKPPKRQISCRASKITKILMSTRPDLCLTSQGDYCGDCELRAHPN